MTCPGASRRPAGVPVADLSVWRNESVTALGYGLNKSWRPCDISQSFTNAVDCLVYRAIEIDERTI